MKKTALLFSGGGSQYPGMMKEFYDNIVECKDIFNKANEIVGIDLANICFNGTEEELGKTNIMIPAIFTSDVAAYAALRKYDIKVDAVAGYSLGEWAAIVAAGVIPFEDALKLVQLRSDEMAKATPSNGAGMAAVLGKPDEFVEDLCKRADSNNVWPTNYNYPGQVTVSGTKIGLEKLEKIVEDEGIVYQRLAVDVPSHCPLMTPAMEAIREALKHYSFNSPSCPVVSNATAMFTTDPKEIKENIITQLVSPVKFRQSIMNMIDDGYDMFIELGPGHTLAGFVHKINKKLKDKISYANIENVETLQMTLDKLND